MPDESRAIQSPLCPRCGYDLRGTVATWREACPLDGVCSECGLVFVWSDILRRHQHPYLFEYHWRRRPVRSAWATILKASRPWRFWREVRLTDPIHVRPAFFLVFAVALLPLILRLLVCVSTLIPSNHPDGGTYRPSWFNRWPAWGDNSTVSEIIEMIVQDTLGLIPTWHFFCVDWITEMPWPAPYWFVIAWMPLTALTFVLLPVSLRRAKVRAGHIVRVAVYGVGWLALPLVALALFEAVIFATGFVPGINVRGAILNWIQFEVPLTIGPVPTLPVVFGPLTVVWWWGACRNYLRLADGLLVAALLTLLSGLFTMVGFVIWAGLVGEWSWWMDGV